MPDKKITDLVDGSPLQPTDEFVVARAGDNFKIDGADVVGAATAAVTKHDVTLDGNTAGALALVSSGTMSLAGGNNITLSQAGNAITISGANIGGAQTGISGIANSETTYTSGTVSLSELGALTIRSSTGQIFQLEAPATSSLSATGAVSISTNGSTISIGAPVQSTQVETQTFIAGISASDTLYTSGNVRLTGVGGGVTVSSNTGQRVDISVAAPVAQTVQTQNVVDLTLSGNTAGALALVSSGTATLAGGNNITLSQAGNAITISGPNVAGAQTGISGIANSQTTYTSGTVSLSELGAVTIRSTTGNQFQISVNSQSVQPETQTFIAGVSASDTLYTSGNVRITGVGGGVTVSSNTGQRIDISVAAQSVQPETQTFIAGISASNTLYTSGNVRISGSQAATVRSGTGQLVIIDVPAQTTQVETQTFIAGVSASDTLYTSGNVRITGVGGGITVSSNTGQRVDLSVAAPVAQTNQAGSVYAISNTSGTSSGTYDARTLSIAGAGMITVAASNSGWRINATQSVQPETQTFIGGISASDTLYTSGSVRITGVGGGVTVSSNTGQRVDISVAAPVAQTNQSGNVYASSNTFGTSSGTYDARSLSIAGSGAISVAASNSGWVISAPAAVAQTNQAGSVYAISNTSGTSSGTYDARTLSIAGAGIVTVAASNSGWRINASQSVQPETQTFVGGISASDTNYTSGTVRFTGSNMITVKSSGAGQTIILDATQSVQTQGILNVALSNIGNTAGDTGINSGTRMVLAGGNNITLSASTAANATTVTISAPNLGAGAFSGGVSTGGNTGGATGVTGTRMVFVGSDNITLSQTTAAAGGTISIFGPAAGGFSMGVSTGGNTAGDTGVTGTRVVLVGDSPISLSQTTGAAGATISIDAPATSSLSATGGVEISTNGSTISIGVPVANDVADWQNFPLAQAVAMTGIQAISKTPLYWNDHIDAKVTANSFVFRLSAITTATLQSFTAHLGVYTLVNSTSANRLGSLSETYVLSTASSASWSGIRNYVMTGIGTHTGLSVLTGGEYVFGLMFSAGASQSMNYSLYGAGIAGGPLGRIIPGVNQASTGNAQGAQPLVGRGSTTVNAMPANVVASELINQGQGASMQLHPWIYIRS